MKKIKSPYKGYELFEKIINILKEKNLLPEEILDYYSTSTFGDRSLPILNYEFDISVITKYGGNEGIYTDVYLEGDFGYPNKKRIVIGCCKTLNTDPESMYRMYKMAADIYIYGSEFIEYNLEDFTWQGYKLGYYEDDKLHWVYEVDNSDRIIYNIKQMIKWNPKRAASVFCVFNNAENKMLSEKEVAKFKKQAISEMEDSAYV